MSKNEPQAGAMVSEIYEAMRKAVAEQYKMLYEQSFLIHADSKVVLPPGTKVYRSRTIGEDDIYILPKADPERMFKKSEIIISHESIDFIPTQTFEELLKKVQPEPSPDLDDPEVRWEYSKAVWKKIWDFIRRR